MDPRQTFLIEMYKQMFADINRHMTVIWQSVSVVIGAFALFSLAEKGIISIDVSASLIVILCGWLISHMVDAGYWYNRNLVIISNIEKQFLLESDLRDIQMYFGDHRDDNKMIKHILIQNYLGIALLTLVLLFHFTERVIPGFSLSINDLDPSRALPYLASIGVWLFCRRLVGNRDQAYVNFVTNSPGIEVNTSSVTYGIGHQTKRSKQNKLLRWFLGKVKR